MLIYGLCALVSFLNLGPASNGERLRPLKRVDRAHIVGAPVLDASAKPGVYVWREGGRYRFAVRGRGEVRFRLRGQRRLVPGASDGLTWVRKKAREVIGRATNGRASLDTAGTLLVGPAYRGRKKVRIFVGPLAHPTVGKVKIGLYGAVKTKRSGVP